MTRNSFEHLPYSSVATAHTTRYNSSNGSTLKSLKVTQNWWPLMKGKEEKKKAALPSHDRKLFALFSAGEKRASFS